MFYSSQPAGLERHFILYEDGLNILEGCGKTSTTILKKQVAINAGADSYTAMKTTACNKSRWKAANQSND
jgi:hypothetical protein